MTEGYGFYAGPYTYTEHKLLRTLGSAAPYWEQAAKSRWHRLLKTQKAVEALAAAQSAQDSEGCGCYTQCTGGSGCCTVLNPGCVAVIFFQTPTPWCYGCRLAGQVQVSYFTSAVNSYSIEVPGSTDYSGHKINASMPLNCVEQLCLNTTCNSRQFTVWVECQTILKTLIEAWRW